MERAAHAHPGLPLLGSVVDGGKFAIIEIPGRPVTQVGKDYRCMWRQQGRSSILFLASARDSPEPEARLGELI